MTSYTNVGWTCGKCGRTGLTSVTVFGGINLCALCAHPLTVPAPMPPQSSPSGPGERADDRFQEGRRKGIEEACREVDALATGLEECEEQPCDHSPSDMALATANRLRSLLSTPGAPDPTTDPRDEDVRAALRGMLDVFWPTPDEGHTGFVDRLGMQFYRETGVWPHFKSASMEMHVGDPEEARKRWTAWLNEKRDAAAAAAQRALSASPGSPGRAPTDTPTSTPEEKP